MTCSWGHSFLSQPWGVAPVLRGVFKHCANWREVERTELKSAGSDVAVESARRNRGGERSFSVCPFPLFCFQGHMCMIPVGGRCLITFLGSA